MSKDKKKKTKVLSANVISSCDGYWEWFDRSDISTAPYGITGKYLFFSLNRDLLIEIAINELENGGFHHAKTHMAGVTPPSGEYVCPAVAPSSYGGNTDGQEIGHLANYKHCFPMSLTRHLPHVSLSVYIYNKLLVIALSSLNTSV